MIEIFDNGLTDKVQTGMAQFYIDVFGPIREEITSVCEIGIERGGSLLAWLDFFPNANIVGIDISPNAVGIVSDGYYKPEWRPRIQGYLIDAGDRELLQLWINTYQPKFDLIIDDGSHLPDDVSTAWDFLWHECLSPGGYYVIEDTNYHSGDLIRNVAQLAIEQTTVSSDILEIHFRYGICWMRKEG